MAVIDHARRLVHHKGAAYPFAEFPYKTSAGFTDFGIRLLSLAAVGRVVSDGHRTGEATGKVEHILSRHDEDFYRFECRTPDGILVWINSKVRP